MTGSLKRSFWNRSAYIVFDEAFRGILLALKENGGLQTLYSTLDPKWSETEHEVFRDFGHAAFTWQMLEAALIQVLVPAAEFAGRITFDKKADIESELTLSFVSA